MQRPGQAPHACTFEPLPFPPIGCGGPDVRGFDLATMHGVSRYSNGVMATGYLRLAGTWDGHELTLTRPPEAASAVDATAVPQCVAKSQQIGGSTMSPLMQRVVSDDALLKAHGVMPLEFGDCGDSIFIVVPVADRATVDFLTARYGQIQVSGWLRPVT
jgi:hypothetical protein